MAGGQGVLNLSNCIRPCKFSGSHSQIYGLFHKSADESLNSVYVEIQQTQKSWGLNPVLHNEKPLHWEAHSAQLEKAHVQQWRRSATKTKFRKTNCKFSINGELQWYFMCFIILLVVGFFFGHMARGILPYIPKDQTGPPVLEVQSLNHWTTREIPKYFILRVHFMQRSVTKCCY